MRRWLSVLMIAAVSLSLTSFAQEQAPRKDMSITCADIPGLIAAGSQQKDLQLLGAAKAAHEGRFHELHLRIASAYGLEWFVQSLERMQRTECSES